MIMNPAQLTLIQQSHLDNLVNSGKLHQVPVDYSKAKRFIEQADQSLMELPSIEFENLRKARNQSRYFASPIGNSQADETIICARELLTQVQKTLNYQIE